MSGKTGTLTRTALALALVTAIQMLHIPKAVSGALVNSILVLVYLFVGLRASLWLAFLSPLLALFTQHLPPMMSPLLPFIALGNCLLILTYHQCRKFHSAVRLMVPAAVKALAIIAGGALVSNLISLSRPLQAMLSAILGLQFFTAVAGVFCAEYAVQKIRKR
ncbi:MAG: hypothetical protein PHW04_16870 [Candidatus Wallbacteria bacterium]|nr:hypothetical protein [Candidatus Wallbacteria bacterium]